MNNYQQNQLSNNTNIKNSQKQQQNQGVINDQQKNIKTRLQQHREELDILELQIQQEQKSGFGRSQNNVNQIVQRKSQSLQRQPLSNSNSISFSNQLLSQEQNRPNNFSPLKRLSNNQAGGQLNQSKPLGILLSQAGQDSIKPQKNKVQIMIDDTSILMKNLPNSSVSIKQNEQAVKYPLLSTGSRPQHSFNPNLNIQNLSQFQNSNIYESGAVQSKLVNYPLKQSIGYNQLEQQGGNNLQAYSGDSYAQKYTKVNKVEKQLPQSQSQSILKNNLQNDRGAIKNTYQTISNEIHQNTQTKQSKGIQQNQIVENLPHYLKNLQVVKLPNEDEVHFDELNLQAEIHLLNKYSEFMNNDNDLFYLESNFSKFYNGSVQNFFQSEQKDSYAFKGALAVCFDTKNPQADYKYIHPNYKVSLNKIANNPMIYAGLASQSGHVNLDQSRISNSKTTTTQSEQNYNFDKSNNNNNSKNHDSISNQSHLASRNGINGNQSAIKSQNISRGNTNSTNSNQYFFNRKNFQIPQINGGDLMSELQRVQNEFRTHKVSTYNIFIVTKFKVKIDIGFLQISFNMNNLNASKTYSSCIIHRLYISRIYRKLNYAHFISLQVYNFLFATYQNLEKVSITVSSHSQEYLKFKQSIGFRLENVKQTGDQNTSSQQIRLILKRSDFGQILTHIQSKKFIEKPGLDNTTIIQNKIHSNNLIPSF